MTTHTGSPASDSTLARSHPRSTQQAPPTADPEATGLPRRRIMVVLSLLYLLLFAALIGTGGESPDPKTAGSKIIADYDTGDVMIQLAVYSTVVAAALLVFYGGALRAVLRSRRPTWTADLALAGLILMAVAIVGFGVSALAVHSAVATGNPAVAQTANVLDNSNFPTAMLGMVTTMVATGVTALRTGLLARWLAVASIVIGCLAPLGPGGFVPFALFPIWLVAVAVLLRRDNEPAETATA